MEKKRTLESGCHLRTRPGHLVYRPEKTCPLVGLTKPISPQPRIKGAFSPWQGCAQCRANPEHLKKRRISCSFIFCNNITLHIASAKYVNPHLEASKHTTRLRRKNRNHGYAIQNNVKSHTTENIKIDTVRLADQRDGAAPKKKQEKMSLGTFLGDQCMFVVI